MIESNMEEETIQHHTKQQLAGSRISSLEAREQLSERRRHARSSRTSVLAAEYHSMSNFLSRADYMFVKKPRQVFEVERGNRQSHVHRIILRLLPPINSDV